MLWHFARSSREHDRKSKSYVMEVFDIFTHSSPPSHRVSGTFFPRIPSIFLSCHAKQPHLPYRKSNQEQMMTMGGMDDDDDDDGKKKKFKIHGSSYWWNVRKLIEFYRQSWNGRKFHSEANLQSSLISFSESLTHETGKKLRRILQSHSHTASCKLSTSFLSHLFTRHLNKILRVLNTLKSFSPFHIAHTLFLGFILIRLLACPTPGWLMTSN